MTPRMNANLMKVLFVIVMLMVMLLQSFFSHAGTAQGKKVQQQTEMPDARAVNVNN